MEKQMFTYARLAVYVLVASIFLGGCGSKQSETPQKTFEDFPEEPWVDSIIETDMPLEQKLSALLDTIQDLRKAAFASELEKQNSGRLLAEEIEQSMSSYLPADLRSIKDAASAMEKNMYNETTLGSEQVMERYDSCSNALMAALNTTIEKIPEFENHARARLLYADILKADKGDFFIRKDYNNYVREFNILLKEERQAIEALDPSFKDLRPFPFFYGDDPAI